MTGRERVRARKVAARKERIRQAKAVKRAKPGGLAGMGVSMPDMAAQAKAAGLVDAIGQMVGGESRTDVAAWIEGQEVPHE